MSEDKKKAQIHSSGNEDDDENAEYNVVTDIEERYSIWLANQKIPMYWKAEGVVGKKQDILNYIERVWTDMRPLSLRIEMERSGVNEDLEKRKPTEEKLRKFQEDQRKALEEGIDHFHKPQPPNDLVRRLMKEQEVEIIRYRNRETGEPDIKKLTAAVQRGYVLVKFHKTTGGTELGASLDTTGSGKPDPGSFDYSVPGKLSIKGRLKLDYCPVMLFATIDLETFKGTGHLEVIPNWRSPQEIRNEEKLKKMEEERKQQIAELQRQASEKPQGELQVKS